MRTLAVLAVLTVSVFAGGHLPDGDENGNLIAPGEPHPDDGHEKLRLLEEMVDKFCDHPDEHPKDGHRMLDGHGMDEGKPAEMGDHHDEHHEDHEEMHPEEIKDKWLCLEAQQMLHEIR